MLALLIASSLAQPLFWWDSWMYHLPFSALLWDIGNARHAFVLSQEMALRYDGFPVAAEWIQGALWKLTGTINATTLVNSCALALYVLVAARALGASLAVLAFAALASPMVALHASSAYIDLFVGVCIALQAVAAVRLESLLRQRQRSGVAVWCLVYIASAALAGNSKVTGPVLSGAIALFLVGYIAWRRIPLERGAFKLLLAVAAAASLLSGATALRNTYAFGNPLYPFDTTIAGVHLSGPELEYRNYPRYTERLGPLARPANWALSVSEIDWLVRGVAPDYTLDSATGDKPLRDGPARTGGYGGALVVLTLALGGALVVRAARLNPAALAEHRFLLALFVLVTGVTAFMPQSHELRYYLHWPLMLVTVVAVVVRIAGLRAKTAAAISAAYLAAFVASQQLNGSTLDVLPVITQAQKIGYETVGLAVDRLRAKGETCLGPEYSPRQFAYSAVFHGGAYVVEQGLYACRRFPAFVAP